jgi:hypothetical protein
MTYLGSKNFIKYLVLFLIVLFLFLAFPFQAFAENIRSYDVTLDLSANGQLAVTEQITYDFKRNSRHGLLREIPLAKQLDNQVQSLSFDLQQILRNDRSEIFSLQKDQDSASIKIGDPQTTITGIQIYTIQYLLGNVILNFQSHDELFYNPIGTSWSVPIQNASVELLLPTDLQVQKTKCLTGSADSTAQNCQIQDLTTFRANNLAPNEGLSIVASFPPNTFPASTLTRSTNPLSWISPAAWIGILLTWLFSINFLAPFFVWQNFSPSLKKQKYGLPPVNFDLPTLKSGQRIPPAAAGIIDSLHLEKDDIVATIFDLAMRRHLRISQVHHKTFNPFDQDQEFHLQQTTNTDDLLLPFESILINELFRTGASVKLQEATTDFYSTFQKIETSLFDHLKEQQIYLHNPSKTRTAYFVSAAVSLLLAGPILSLVLLFLGRSYNGRTPLGDQLDWQIDGLKEFLQKMSRNYTWQANELALVERMIPYAIALGYVDKFMQQLQRIQPDYQPQWYSGSSFLSSYSLLNSSFNSSITTSPPSSSSGFSSGSFSGGGFGGGGGSSW